MTPATEAPMTYGPITLNQFLSESVALAQHVGSLKPLAEDIPRFLWSSEYQEQEENGLKVQHFPEGALQYLLVEKGWVEEKFDEEVWLKQDAKAIGLNEIECHHCHGDLYLKRPYHGLITGIKVLRGVPCRCIFFRSYFSVWMNPANVATTKAASGAIPRDGFPGISDLDQSLPIALQWSDVQLQSGRQQHSCPRLR